MSITLRQIVCDTGPLISLEKITAGHRFIRQLYNHLIVPPAVMQELVAGSSRLRMLICTILTPQIFSWSEILKVSPRDRLSILMRVSGRRSSGLGA